MKATGCGPDPTREESADIIGAAATSPYTGVPVIGADVIGAAVMGADVMGVDTDDEPGVIPEAGPG